MLLVAGACGCSMGSDPKMTELQGNTVKVELARQQGA
jgi:hypothetical protein